jgi:SNF2 family DNA or RNA helicase
MYSQFEFLDWRILGHRNFYSFRARYAVLKRVNFTPVIGRNRDGTSRRAGRDVDLVVGYKNEEELQQIIAPHSYRVLKKDCLDLPPKIYMPMREVSMHPDQLRIYEQLRRDAFAEVNTGTVTATMAMTRIMRLQQVLCGWVGDDDGRLQPVASRRLDALLEVLDDHSGKAIIWTPHDACIRQISARLEEVYGSGSVARFWGGNRDTRLKEEAMFKSDAKCRFMVATQSAGGMGNTWVEASLVVYYSNHWSLEQRLQSEDRAHRHGQTNPVTYVDLGVLGTVDEKIIQALRDKLNLATLLQGEAYREWLIK